MRTAVHPCPNCRCGQEPPLVIDTDAPFYELVLLIDRLIWDRPRQHRNGRAA